MSGIVSYEAGVSAEESVARSYRRQGRSVTARRWRGSAGEIDLVARDGAGLIFVEVKKARSFARAAERITRRQAARVMATAEEFLAGEPDGLMTAMQFDVALVDGKGEVRILENALSA